MINYKDELLKELISNESIMQYVEVYKGRLISTIYQKSLVDFLEKLKELGYTEEYVVSHISTNNLLKVAEDVKE